MIYQELQERAARQYQRVEFNRKIGEFEVGNDVINAIQSVDRRDFVPRYLLDREMLAGRVYRDTVVPLSETSSISQPYVVALMTDLLRPISDQRILEVGTASGYQAAILSRLVGPTGQIHTIEYDEILAKEAERRLARLGYKNVMVHSGDGLLGDVGHAPFNGVIATAGARVIPRVWIDQLSEGGRFVVPVGHDPYSLDMTVGVKKGDTLETMVMSEAFFHHFRGPSEGAFEESYLDRLGKFKLVMFDSIAQTLRIEAEDLLLLVSNELRVSPGMVIDRMKLPIVTYKALESGQIDVE